MKPPKLDDSALLRYLLEKYNLTEGEVALAAGHHYGLNQATSEPPITRTFKSTTPTGKQRHRLEVKWTTPSHRITATAHGRILKIKKLDRQPEKSQVEQTPTVICKRKRIINGDQ